MLSILMCYVLRKPLHFTKMYVELTQAFELNESLGPYPRVIYVHSDNSETDILGETAPILL